MKQSYTLQQYVKKKGITEPWTIKFMLTLTDEELQVFKNRVRVEMSRSKGYTANTAAYKVAWRWYKREHFDIAPRQSK